MTYPISDVTRRVVYSGSAGTGPYTFTFEVLTQGDIGVYKNSTLLTLTTDYTVTINADGTGSITLTSAATSSDTIAIFGNKGIQRSTDFVTGGDLFANSLNDELDAQTIFAQQNAEAIIRSIRAPQFDPTGLDMTLPEDGTRAGKVLGFNASGEPVVTNSSVTQIDNVVEDFNTLILTGAGGNAAAVVYNPAGSGAVATTVQAKLRETVSVKDFGAVGDGVTDDTAAIQAAVDSGANIVFVPDGTYKTTSSLSLTNPIKLIGTGGTINLTVSGDACFEIQTSNVTFDGLIIHGNDTTDVYVANSVGIQALSGSSSSYYSDINIQNCEIKYFGGSAVNFQYIENSNVRNNRIERIGKSGVRCLSVSNLSVIENIIEDIYPGDAGAAPYLNAYGITLSFASSDPVSDHCRVIGNYIRNIPSWEGIDTHSGQNITIADNTLEDVRVAIALTTNTGADCENITISGNTSKGFASGELVRDSTTFETGSGIVANMGNVGSQGNGLTITGNALWNHGGKQTGNTGGAIKVERARSVTVSANICRDAYRYGIRIADNVQDAVVVGNHIDNVITAQSVREGISFSSLCKATCDNNHVSSGGNDAFSIATPSSADYGVIFDEGNSTPNGTQIMSAASKNAIQYGTFLGGAKAWIKFNGSTGATLEYFGCTLTKNSTGDYTITWDEAVANNLVIASSDQYATRVVSMNNADCLIKTYDSANVLADASPIAVVMFGFKND